LSYEPLITSAEAGPAVEALKERDLAALTPGRPTCYGKTMDRGGNSGLQCRPIIGSRCPDLCNIGVTNVTPLCGIFVALWQSRGDDENGFQKEIREMGNEDAESQQGTA